MYKVFNPSKEECEQNIEMLTKEIISLEEMHITKGCEIQRGIERKKEIRKRYEKALSGIENV